jgi:hypothetical protein
MKLIGTIVGNVELEMLEEIFRDNGITLTPQYRENEEVLAHTMGTLNDEIDLFVDDDHEVAAMNLYSEYIKGTEEVIASEAAIDGEQVPEEE